MLLAIGWVFYGAHIPAAPRPPSSVTVIVGALSFCCLGYALGVGHPQRGRGAAHHPGGDPPALLHLRACSCPSDQLPAWLVDIADVFPVRHLAAALLVAYNPHTTGAGFAGWDLLIVAGVGCLRARGRAAPVQLAAARSLTRRRPDPDHRRKIMATEVQTQTGRLHHPRDSGGEPANSRRVDSPSSSTPCSGTSPGAAHFSARNAEPRSRPTKPCTASVGAPMRVRPVAAPAPSGSTGGVTTL